MVSTSPRVVAARPRTPAPRNQAIRFLVAVGISFYGDWLTTVALVVLLYRTTGSATAPALYIVARVAPRVFGPAPGGGLADRFGPARIAAACSLFKAAFTALIVVFAHNRVVWAIYVAVACAQFLNSLAQPAYGALIPQVTSERRLGRVNGIYGSLFASSILVSPAIGALLLPHVAPELLIAVDAVTFVIAAIILITLHTRGAAVPGSSPRGFSTRAAGGHARRHASGIRSGKPWQSGRDNGVAGCPRRCGIPAVRA